MAEPIVSVTKPMGFALLIVAFLTTATCSVAIATCFKANAIVFAVVIMCFTTKHIDAILISNGVKVNTTCFELRSITVVGLFRKLWQMLIRLRRTA